MDIIDTAIEQLFRDVDNPNQPSKSDSYVQDGVVHLVNSNGLIARYRIVDERLGTVEAMECEPAND